MPGSDQLLGEYVSTGSEVAFRELVSQYIHLVYAAARRHLHGDQELAKDVTQTVFIELARKAPSISPGTALGGWLCQRARFAATKALRTEKRRRMRELTSADPHSDPAEAPVDPAPWGPILEEALAQLPDPDRTALTLRFFEERDLRSVGEALGVSEEAARKRIDRALAKLAAKLGPEGTCLTPATLATMLSAAAFSSPPAGLAAAISATALTNPAISGLSVFLMKMTAPPLLKTAIIAVLVAAGALVTWSLRKPHFRPPTELRGALASSNGDENPSSPPHAEISEDQRASLQTERDAERLELARLRAEVAQLRARQSEVTAAHQAFVEQKQTELELRHSLSNAIPGRLRTREDWSDKGAGDPFSAVESMLWSASHGDSLRLAEFATPEALEEQRWPVIPEEQPPIVRVGAVNFVSASENAARDRAVVTAFIREDFSAPPGGNPYSVHKLRGWKLIKSEGAWRVSRILFFDIAGD